MARPKGMGLQDDVPFTLRMSKERKREFKRRATQEAGVSMALYARCKIFDEPLPVRGTGRTRKKAAK